MKHFARNLVLLMFVAAAAFVLFFIGCPWLAAMGHPGLCYAFFAVLIVILLYARAGAAPRKRSPE